MTPEKKVLTEIRNLIINRDKSEPAEYALGEIRSKCERVLKDDFKKEEFPKIA